MAPFVKDGEPLQMTSEQKDAALKAQVDNGLRTDWGEVRYSIEQAAGHLDHIYVALAKPDRPQLADGKAPLVWEARALIRELQKICAHWHKSEDE